MSIEKLRGLSKYGVLADPDPYDLPVEAFTAGVNVRFRNGHISSGPVFRNVLGLGTTDPRFCFSASPASSNFLFIGYKNGKISKEANNTETDYTLVGYTPSVVEATWSSTVLGSVVYANRSDRAPWYLRASDSSFQNLSASGSAPDKWDSTWSCNILRSCAGALVALYVTKGATTYTNMVKTSSLPTAGAVPTSWDQTNPATLATENILTKMEGPIVDGCPLGQDLVIYGSREAWLMHADNSTFVYSYTKLPFKKGAMNANCSIEHDGKNFVFGTDDIWMHDGNSEVSLLDKKNRDFVFGSLNISAASKCFVQHNPKLNEIYFAYVGGDQYVNFGVQNGIDGCNRQAVLNLSDMTWTFDDLPSTFSACNAVISNSLTYATVTATYTTMGGTYQDQEDGLKRTTVYVGSLNATYSLSTSLYALDPYGVNSNVAYPVDTNATAPRFIERIGLDLDELNAQISGYKTLSTIYPQARLGSGASNLMIAVGASDNISSAAPAYSAYQPYNGADLYKIDFNVAGRWVAYKCLFSDYRELTITGFDFDLKMTGKR